MSSTLSLAILNDLVPGGFRYGTNLLIEFTSDSIWYETSLTIAAHALRRGIRTEYHTFQHLPREVEEALARLGLDVKKLEQQDLLRIADSYTVQTGIGVPETTGPMPAASLRSVKLSDWSIGAAKAIKGDLPEAEQRRRSLHVDDNVGVLSRYNKENEIIDYWRLRVIPLSRALELVVLNGLTTGVASDSFYRQFETLCDGIIDFRSQEIGGEMQQNLRIRTMRGRTFDSRWRRLRILESSEVTIADRNRTPIFRVCGSGGAGNAI